MPHSDSLTIITRNSTMRDVIARINIISNSDSSVLLIGETGVGKEIFAEYVHRTSNRVNRPFVKISLAALPPELLSSELFGHEKGSYTGALNEKKGLFEIADTGTIFLDDIDDVPYDIQAKLLRVLESKELMRVGGTSPIPIDTRLITASKVDLKELVNRGIFRADLFYRINVVPLIIPPLRERRDDILPLVEYFLRYYQPDKTIKLSKDAARAFVNYPYPGNVRERKNIIQRIGLFVNGEIKSEDLPLEVRSENAVKFLIKSCNNCYVDGEMGLEQIIHCLEHNLIREALSKSKGNQSLAAKELRLSLSTFRDKLKKYDLKNNTDS